MNHLKGHIGFSTRDAAIPGGEQEGGPRFPSCQSPSLVLFPSLQHLGIELDLQATYWKPA
jgi:hypothetical protein